MAVKFEALRGMEDILPGEIEKWQWIEEKARIFFESRGFKEIRTPLLEHTELFARSVGEASDIVHKEMFSFQDRGERNISLRPEMTASVARAVIEHGLLTQAKSLRFYYIGPMFRAERPQAGRKRQFHQIGVEIINEENVGGFNKDFELIYILYQFLQYVGLKEPHFRLNDLGSFEDQKQIASGLHDYFFQEKNKLCSDCQWRLEKNVLRIFDCKVESCQPVINQAPWEKIAPLSKSFNALKESLENNVPVKVDRRLVRGLDYYNGTVFEVTAGGLGAQDALAGGGRYDRLYSQLGGPETRCTGFSIGVERLLMALPQAQIPKIYFANLETLEENKETEEIFWNKALKLRSQGILVETMPSEISLSKHLKKANQLGIRFVVILGADEIQKKKFTIKDMQEKKQMEIGFDEVGSFFQGILNS